MPRFGKRKDPVLRVVATVRVDATPADRAALVATMERLNDAANWLAGEAFLAPCTDFATLQKQHYRTLRTRFGLSSQMALLVLGKVAGVYKRDPSIRPAFRPHGAVAFDTRLYTLVGHTLSIRALNGRLQGIPLRLGPSAERWLAAGAWKEADLVLRRNGKLMLHITVELPVPPVLAPAETTGTLGVDFGIVNVAADSDGNVYSGEKIEQVRQWYAGRRAALQKVNTRNSKRRLRKLSGKEARFKRNENHRISKQLVARAQGTNRRIAIEDLRGIRGRVTVRHTQRARHASWSFWQLRVFLVYKAAHARVARVVVDPRRTSTTCFVCKHWDRRSRRSQAEFVCVRCGHRAPADTNASKNIAYRADVTQPMASHDDAGNPQPHGRVGAESPPSADASLAL